VTRLLRGWRGLGALALLGVFLVSGASAAGALNVAHAPALSHALSPAPPWRQSTPLSSALPHTEPVHFVTPPEPHTSGGQYANESSNWSGQIATGSTFSGISADWVVPSIQPTQASEASGTWIGIDNGEGPDGSIIQTGTGQLTHGGATTYYAWYELYPQNAVVLGDVSPGDQMEAFIGYDSGSTWTLELTDVSSRNSTGAQPVTYTGPADTAEWIEEAPSVTSGPQPALANFGSATFTDMGLTAAGADSIDPTDMVDGSGNVIASTGAISNSSFTIDYVPERTGTAVSANPSSSSFGSAVTYSTLVSSDGPSPTGTVAFTAGSTALCTATLSTSGLGSCVATNTPQGNDVVQARYSGDANSDPSSGTTNVDVGPAPSHGYWLVGSDGGIFSFGTAQFWGSTGSIHLQRPVVGIVPTADHNGYWLDASDGGVFSYGDTQFYGSIPGLGLHPAGSGLPNSLNAPIVGMVPSHDDNGYFMVASDGGVFAFGDAHFAGSCPGIGGCAGSAVAVMPDASGNGYWLVTSTGSIYTFGDAPYFGAPGHGTVTSAVATPDGKGYWVLLSDGQVFGYGEAANLGSPAAANFNGLDAANAIFATSDGGGYWVSSALGGVYNFGDAPNDGGMTGTHLNGPIIAATGF
jgi:Peptidase A4 family/Bacterial Ig-like domain (group 3)